MICHFNVKYLHYLLLFAITISNSNANGKDTTTEAALKGESKNTRGYFKKCCSDGYVSF